MDSKLLNKNQIKIKQPLTTQKEVFQQIAAIAVDQGITSDPDEVIDGLLKREQEGTTAFKTDLRFLMYR
ncbi:PTS sugar transporter subunit IIA [Gracilibacillus sp. JCM 18860]|uniref:PTS sugar transporter subunit IIA n=1 Tax=Gracilibacillus sp. JCM 18860 TaxID=1306159 RepID=UPI0006D2918D